MSDTRRRHPLQRPGRRGILRRPTRQAKVYEEAPPFLRYRGRFYDRSDLEFMAERAGILITDKQLKGEKPWPLNPTRIVDRYYAQGGELEGAPLS